MIKKVSDSGGVAARRGFKYQDHVAAGLALEMIGNATITRIECETADDIVVAWTIKGSEVLEYVQVKTTEGDKKWSYTEICERKIPKQPTSLAEKSLLCATQPGPALFRIVSRRAIAKSLSPLELARTSRTNSAELDAFATKIAKKLKTKSPTGLDLKNWATHALWQTPGDVSALTATNQQTLISLANDAGANPVYTHIKDIYDDLLSKVDKAALASKIKSPNDKIITRTAILQWWNAHLEKTQAAAQKTSKPYRAATDGFFVELHNIQEGAIQRAMTGYDAQFELKKWRSEALADYLANWLPELALKASELVEVRPTALRQKLQSAMREISRHTAIDTHRLLAETLLHAVLRHRFNSEPIACKLFYKAQSGSKSFGNAHIVHSDSGDQLWLGRAGLAKVVDYDQVVKTILDSLNAFLDADLLKDEREVIVTLREPNHLLPTTLENALRKHSPIDDLLKAIAIPILLAYDSDVINAGFSSDYKDKLVAEIIARYGTIKPLLPKVVEAIHVHVFFIPVECVQTLVTHFQKRIGAI